MCSHRQLGDLRRVAGPPRPIRGPSFGHKMGPPRGLWEITHVKCFVPRQGSCPCCYDCPLLATPSLPDLPSPTRRQLSLPSTSPPHVRKRRLRWGGVCVTSPGEAGTDGRPPQGQGRRPASPAGPAGPCVRLLPQARMTDGPRRKGHCLGSGCVFGGGRWGGAPSERSLGPRLGFGGLGLASNRTLFWLLKMGRFGS